MSESEFAKVHLREHLGNLLVSPIAEGFWSIHKSSVELCERNSQPSEVLRTFQNMLTRIPEWSESTLQTEIDRIEKVTQCSYLDDLLMGVFIAYMKSFASLHYRGGLSEIQIDFDRPSLGKFVHELYKHSARKLWQTAYLFKTLSVSSEQQARNRQEVEKTISECMEQVIRSFLPWQSITKKYFSDKSVDLPQQQVVEDYDSDSDGEEGERKSVHFEDSDEDSDEDKPKISLSDEQTTIDFKDLDEPPAPTPVVEVQEVKEVKEKDPLDEISEKVGETLVLNL